MFMDVKERCVIIEKILAVRNFAAIIWFTIRVVWWYLIR